MILKRLPEDFKVTETPEIKDNSAGNFSIYLLKKRNIDTFDVLQIIQKKLNLKIEDIGIAGLKDKHAETEQYLSIKGRSGKNFNIKERNFSLWFLFYAKKMIYIGSLKENKFEITVRKIQPSYIRILKGRMALLENGVPNYYGEQRFGSYSSKKGFLGKSLINGDYETAIKILLTHYIKSENKVKKEFKKYILANWKLWDDIIDYIHKNKINGNLIEKTIIHLNKSNNDFYEAVKLIPKRLIRLYIEAYQSYVWNEITRKLIDKLANKKFSLSYIAGGLIFYESISEQYLNMLKDTSFNFNEIKAHEKINELIQEIKNEVIAKENIRKDALNKPFFSAGILKRRNILVFPKNFKILSEEQDEIYPRFKKVKLAFSLPPGSYATMITRLLFKH